MTKKVVIVSSLVEESTERSNEEIEKEILEEFSRGTISNSMAREG